MICPKEITPCPSICRRECHSSKTASHLSASHPFRSMSWLYYISRKDGQHHHSQKDITHQCPAPPQWYRPHPSIFSTTSFSSHTPSDNISIPPQPPQTSQNTLMLPPLPPHKSRYHKYNTPTLVPPKHTVTKTPPLLHSLLSYLCSEQPCPASIPSFRVNAE